MRCANAPSSPPRRPECRSSCSAQVVAFVQRLRSEDLFKLPGVAETIDWAQALTYLNQKELAPQAVDETLGVLLKYQDDIAQDPRCRGSKVGGRGTAGSRVTTTSPTLAANVMHFARLLRRTGLPVGPAEALAGQQALSLVDIGNRTEARIALRTAMIHRHEHQDVFDQAFNLFWRDPTAAEQAVAMAMLEAQKEKRQDRAPPGSRRVAEAMARPREARPREHEEPPVLDAVLTVSDRERLQRMDFEAMSAEEIAAAKREIRRLVLPLDLRRTRRLRADPLGPVTDLRRTISNSLRQGGEILTIARNRQVTRPPPLVVLCDISGSMSRYAQILLHFLHAVTNDRDRVHVFLFGTRLSNVTRQLRHRDPEVAFQMVSHVVPDWSGGTRIGEALEAFNRLWARRVWHRARSCC